MVSHTDMNVINLYKVFQHPQDRPIGWNNVTVVSNFSNYN